MTDLQKLLFLSADPKYRDFNSSLIPSENQEKFIGVRTPILRSLAKKIYKGESLEFCDDSNERSEVKSFSLDCNDFLDSLPHEYFEENQIHAFIIEQIPDYDECVRRLNQFLPFVNNWATCDQCTPKVFKKTTVSLLNQIKIWLTAGEYEVRFAIRMLMAFYLDKNFSSEYLKMVVQIKSDKYYINMMIAWYLATALAKQWDSTLPLVSNKEILSDWVRKKTIRKALESFRVTDEHKALLRSL